MFTEMSKKSLYKFSCEDCHYFTCKKNDYEKHLSTDKHKNITNVYQCLPIDDKENKQRVCECGKKYSCKQSLYVHKKKCKIEHPQVEVNDQIDIKSLDMNLIMQLLKQNDEFKSLMVEQNNKMIETFQETIQEVCKNNTTITNNGNINSNNKTFNLQVFLNEQCKDAMNIMEFVDSIKLDLDDAESVKKLGYVNGISNIIIKHLKALDVHMRPVHCTDLKRETMYVKFQDVWEKEDNENKLIRKAIKHIAVKNYNAAETFKDVHPDCMDLESKYGEHFLRLKIEALGGSGNDNYESHTKIIKKIAKEVTIDKSL
jgi:hypothetical protein